MMQQTAMDVTDRMQGNKWSSAPDVQPAEQQRIW
jgi:hypothetical protein